MSISNGFPLSSVVFDKDETSAALPEAQEHEEPTGGDQGKGKTISQDEANKLIGAARKEGRTAAEKALLEKLGLKSVDEVEAALAAFRKSEEDKLSEVDKANKGREAAEQKVKELEGYKEKADRYEAALSKQLEAAKKGLPEFVVPLIEKMDPVEALTYIAEHAAELGKTAGLIPETPKGDRKKLSDEEKKLAQDASASLLKRSF